MVYLITMNQENLEWTTLIDSREMGEALDSIEIHAPQYAKAKAERIHLDDYNGDWDISSASLFENTFSTVDSQSLYWKPDGTKYFILNTGGVQDIVE